jgi:hypothetical protein
MMYVSGALIQEELLTNFQPKPKAKSSKRRVVEDSDDDEIEEVVL